MARFPISFDAWYRVLSYAVGLPPSSSYLDLDKEQGRAYLVGVPLRLEELMVSVAEPAVLAAALRGPA